MFTSVCLSFLTCPGRVTTCSTSARACTTSGTASNVCTLPEVATSFCPWQEGTLVLSSSPERPAEEGSSSKIIPAFRPGARSALQLAAPPPLPLAPPAPSSLRCGPKSLVIPDAEASLPLALFSRGLGGGDSERRARGGEEGEGFGRASASALKESWEQRGGEQ